MHLYEKNGLNFVPHYLLNPSCHPNYHKLLKVKAFKFESGFMSVAGTSKCDPFFQSVLFRIAGEEKYKENVLLLHSL